MKVALTTIASLVLLASLPARAEPVERYAFDKPHTQIVFSVNHLGFSNSIGKFTDYEGHFTFDRSAPEKSSAEIVIKTDSIDLDDVKWNEHMKNKDFFNVAEFPVMTFKSTEIKVLSDKTADIAGNLTLLGVTKPVVLHATHNKSDRFPFGDRYVSGFSATAKIKRSDFGMNYGLPGVSDEVDIRIEVEGIREDGEGQKATNQ